MEDLELFERHDYDPLLDDGGLSYRGQSDVMSSAEANPMHIDKVVNKTMSSEFEDIEVICIISQNLGYTIFPLVEIDKNNDAEQTRRISQVV